MHCFFILPSTLQKNHTFKCVITFNLYVIIFLCILLPTLYIVHVAQLQQDDYLVPRLFALWCQLKLWFKADLFACSPIQQLLAIVAIVPCNMPAHRFNSCLQHPLPLASKPLANVTLIAKSSAKVCLFTGNWCTNSHFHCQAAGWWWCRYYGKGSSFIWIQNGSGAGSHLVPICNLLMAPPPPITTAYMQSSPLHFCVPTLSTIQFVLQLHLVGQSKSETNKIVHWRVYCQATVLFLNEE